MLFLRSTLFNIIFYILTAFACLIYVPALILPRKIFISALMIYFRTLHGLEKLILNLDFEVRGQEHLPQKGSFIIAAKHYSTYETMKIHILLGDVSVILKRELMWIPIWGWLAAKAQMIPIDRSSRDKAIQSIENGVRAMKEQERPIVIFPQGTRVQITHSPSDKPYKMGTAHMALSSGLPIIPLSHNSGFFWPRKSWNKRPGCVIFEYNHPILPDGSAKKITQQIESVLEKNSDKLINEAKEHEKQLENNPRA